MLPRIDNSSNSSRTDEYAESALLENRSVGRSLERNRDLTHRPRSATFHHNSGRNDEHSSNRLPIQYELPRRVASKVIMKSFGQNGFESQVQSSPLTRDHIFQIPRRKRSQRLKPRSLQCIETVNELFTSFTLNRDPENSKYLSYNEVIYPKLFNRPTSWRSMAPTRGTLVNGKGGKRDSHLDAAAEMDSMWMVGFIEDARRHQKDTLLKELKYFIRLPDSTVLPNSRSTLDTISLMKTPTSFNSLATSASGRRDNVSAGQLLPGMSIRVEDVDHSENGAAGAGSSEGGKSALTPLENLRLRELERRLSQASLGISDREERRGAGIHAYTAANHKLRKILSGARPPALGPSLKSEGLEAVLHRNREELLAAIRIQRPFKLYFRRKKFGGMIRQLRGVARVQALVRGVVARKYVTEWHSRRSSMVCMWQTFIRRALSNNRRQRYLVVENRAATRLQTVARGGAGRNKARHTRANLAALRIQCLWRGSVDRARADRMWLDTLVTRVQGLVRVMSAKRKVERKRRIYSDASRTIQCCFRGTLARGKMARMIWERSIHQRMTFIRSLASEEDKERESMAVMRRRWNMAQLNERLEEALSAESAAHALVFNLESNEQELQTHRLMLSPRGLQQGWKEEIDNNIEQHRDWITKRKLEAVFSASLTARTLEEEVKRRDELLADWKRRLMQLARWRDVEMRGILDREARRRFDEQHLAERRKIAEEKRKWAVKYVTPSGKPDKLKTRRRSRPWEAFEDPVEGVLKQVFTGGRVDLFANERSPEEALEEAVATRGQGGMPATAWSDGGRVEKVGANVLMSGSLEQVAACLKLQAYDKQVMQLDEVMKPAQEIVSRFGLDLLVERGQARQACDEGVAANYPGNISSSLPQQHAPIEVTALTPSLGWRQEKEDEKNVASAVEKGEGVPERRFDSVEFSPPGTRDRPRSSQTVRGYERDERASVGKLVDRYGAAASIPPGRPLAVGASGTPVPIKWGEEDTVRGRQRQRKLYMLATTNTNASKMSSNGSFSKIPQEKSGEGEGGSRWVSRVPWELLDELEAEKRKLRMWKIWSGHAC